MKWDITPPSVGTLRVRRKFAWAPTCVYTDESQQHQVLVWFETYSITEEYKSFEQRVVLRSGNVCADIKLGWVEIRKTALYEQPGA